VALITAELWILYDIFWSKAIHSNRFLPILSSVQNAAYFLSFQLDSTYLNNLFLASA
jgi:hypothetical protein